MDEDNLNSQSFLASSSFQGPRFGFAFKLGPKGVGYYADNVTEKTETWISSCRRVQVVVQVVESRAVCTGHFLWPAAKHLSNYLCSKNVVAGRKVLELGAGCGLVSLVACCLGAHRVVSTDLPEMLPRLKRNVELNLNSSCIEVRALGWGASQLTQDHSWAIEKFDVILGSDITYSTSAEDLFALWVLLAELCTARTLTILAHAVRNHDQADILRAAVQRHWGGAQVLELFQASANMPIPDVAGQEPVLIFVLEGKPILSSVN